MRGLRCIQKSDGLIRKRGHPRPEFIHKECFTTPARHVPGRDFVVAFEKAFTTSGGRVYIPDSDADAVTPNLFPNHVLNGLVCINSRSRTEQ
jgi:hypothetical protein